MSIYFRTFQHLLPRAKAWRITIEKRLRELFEGLGIIQSDIVESCHDVYAELRPETASGMDKWGEQFNFRPTGTLATDRKTLAGAWRLNDYQSPKQIQDTLRAAGFDVYVHEWWELPVVGAPIARDPNAYANRSAGAWRCGMTGARCGVSAVRCEDFDVFRTDPYILTTKTNDDYIPPSPPSDPTKWPYVFYISSADIAIEAEVPLSRKNEFETLVRKISPAEQWIGIIVRYV